LFPGSQQAGRSVHSLYGYLVVVLGAGIGGGLRHAINRVSLPFGWSFPWGTLTINVVGSLAMGLVAGWFAFHSKSGHARFGSIDTLAMQHVRLFLTTGVLGGFTTFSAFSLETVLLLERGQIAAAMSYAGGSVVLAVGALMVGVALMS
jgi:fluoride exporter